MQLLRCGFVLFATTDAVLVAMRALGGPPSMQILAVVVCIALLPFAVSGVLHEPSFLPQSIAASVHVSQQGMPEICVMHSAEKPLQAAEMPAAKYVIGIDTDGERTSALVAANRMCNLKRVAMQVACQIMKQLKLPQSSKSG